MDFLEKLDSLMNLNGLNKSSLSARSGIPYTTIDSFYKKGYDNVKLSTLTKLADALHTTLDYLVKDTPNTLTPPEQRIGRAYGKATPPVKRTVEVALEPFMDDAPQTKKAPSKTEDAEIAAELHVDTKKIVYIGRIEDEEESKDTTPLPVYDEPAAAGFGNYLDEYAAQEDVDFPASVVPYNADFGIRISGDSMEPEIADGAIVFVEERLEINDGEIGIFVLNGEAYCKRLDVDKRRREVRLVSENEEYEDIVVREHDTLSTVGRVLGSYLPPRK